MYWTTHVAVGMALGSRSKGSLRAFLKGAASHLLLDTVPHYDFNFWPLSLADFLLGVKLQNLFSGKEYGRRMLMGTLGAGLPDIEGALVYFGLLPKKYAFLHRYLPHPETDLKRSLKIETMIILGALLITTLTNKETD